jgi:signal transduction histidine kinase
VEVDRAKDAKLRGLLHAVLSIGDDLDLQTVLHRITEVAAQLVDAEYAALGVVSADGLSLSQFLVVGVDDAMVDRIGSLPAGHGVLGLLITDPKPLRLDDLAQHPHSFGFPPNHPPMHTFLGVPIRVRDVVFGNLYLTEKRGGGSFDEQDEAVVLGLAAAAGVAIQNARLYGESRRRESWLEASSEVSTALLLGVEPEKVLELVAAKARQVTNGTLSFVALPVGEGRLLIEAADGDTAAQQLGRLLPRSTSLLTKVIDGGMSLVLAGEELDLGSDLGDCLAVPLGGGEGGRGVLVVAGIEDHEVDLATRALGSFAAQAAVALELAEHRRDAERFAVFEDRDRIAKDLHDLVIQRLFATGMQLEGALRLIEQRPEEASVRVRRAVDDLDGTIRELRSTIYGLQGPQDEHSSLRALLLQAVDAGAEQLGFPPSLRLDGLLDTLVPPHVSEHLLAALREALSNAARHASASRVDVRVVLRDDQVALEVADDGVGLPPGGRRSGLRNLAARAEQLGGTLELESAPSAGTRVLWQVPVADAG